MTYGALLPPVLYLAELRFPHKTPTWGNTRTNDTGAPYFSIVTFLREPDIKFLSFEFLLTRIPMVVHVVVCGCVRLVG